MSLTVGCTGFSVTVWYMGFVHILPFMYVYNSCMLMDALKLHVASTGEQIFAQNYTTV